MSQLEFTPQELAAIRAEYCKGATDTQFELFISECERRGLRPGVHLVFQLRNAKEYDPAVGASVFVKKPYWITTISALLLIAERTGKYDGASAPEYIYLDDDGNPSVISEIPLPDKSNRSLPREPWAVRVKIRRKDFSEPIVSIVRFDSVAATQKRDNAIVLTDMWVKRPGEQCAKCALANGIRIGFPEEAGHLFLSEEIKSEEEEKPTPVTPASILPEPPVVPQVNQTPAVPTETPRPGEIKTEFRAYSVPATLPPNSGDTLVVKPKPEAVEAAKAAAPDLKPASELPEPKKKGRPKKETPSSPGNGQTPVGGITDSDLSAIGTPTPETNIAENKAEAEKFVAGLDPTPTKEEMQVFTSRVRALTSQGVKSDEIKARVLEVGGTDDTKKVTVRAWKQVLEEFEAKPKPF